MCVCVCVCVWGGGGGGGGEGGIGEEGAGSLFSSLSCPSVFSLYLYVRPSVKFWFLLLSCYIIY